MAKSKDKTLTVKLGGSVKKKGPTDQEKLVEYLKHKIYPHPRMWTPEQVADGILDVLGRDR